MRRVGPGRWTDPAHPVAFEFDGRAMTGQRGDTIASALLANGARVVARSFKRHRPRGIMAAGMEEANAYVRARTGRGVLANALATMTALQPGMRVSSLHAWPDAQRDLAGIADRFAALLPAGFYYKTFMWPAWKLFEPAIRRAAGLDRVPEEPPGGTTIERHAHCDLLVVGGGAAGLAAARACAEAGARVVLVESRGACGGWLRWASTPGELGHAHLWIEEQLAALRACANARVLTHAMAIGHYDHNHVAAIESLARPGQDEERVDTRLWHFRARHVIYATGAIERPLVFADNDRPGVMLASAAHEYLHGYGVAVGDRVAFFANNDSAYAVAADLRRAGIEVAAIVDTRPRPGERARQLAARNGIEAVCGHRVAATAGRMGVTGIAIARQGETRTSRRIECDALLVSGGWTPQVQLYSHCGGSLRYDEAASAFLPRAHAQAVQCAGAINGLHASEAIAADAARAAGVVLAALGLRPVAPYAPAPCEQADPAVVPWWSPEAEDRPNQAWVDLHNDVTAADVALAARENYASVEHLKRYTTLGMGPDQGRTSNVNGLALLAQALGTTIAQTGTTRFRPPLVPACLEALAASAQGELHRPKRLLPAHVRHVELGARFQDYSGWQRPSDYAGEHGDRAAAIDAECRAVRAGAGLFDGSPLGKLEVYGPDAQELLARMYANGIRSLAPGGVRYGVMLTESGYLLDDGVLARLGDSHYLVGPSSGAAQRVHAWLEEWLQCEWPGLRVAIVDVTSAWASYAVAGPSAREVLAAAGTTIDLAPAAFPHMAYREGKVAGARARVQRVSFTGELQYEVNVPASEGARVFDALLAAGRPMGMVPVGLDAWLRLRIDKGYLHLGTDTDGTTTPDDVGLAGLYAQRTGDFIGRRSLARPALVAAGREQLVGLRAPAGARPLSVGACILDPSGVVCGRVTSSAPSVALGQPVALARLRNGRARHGESVLVRDARGTRAATVCGPVFYDPKGARLRA